jgi:hypothetical protein
MNDAIRLLKTFPIRPPSIHAMTLRIDLSEIWLGKTAHDSHLGKIFLLHNQDGDSTCQHPPPALLPVEGNPGSLEVELWWYTVTRPRDSEKLTAESGKGTSQKMTEVTVGRIQSTH